MVNFFVDIHIGMDKTLGLFEVCNKDAKRNHYVKNVSIESLFQEDQAQMLPLNEVLYEVFLIEPRKAVNYAKVTFDNNL